MSIGTALFLIGAIWAILWFTNKEKEREKK
jgi:hypothetical protein